MHFILCTQTVFCKSIDLVYYKKEKKKKNCRKMESVLDIFCQDIAFNLKVQLNAFLKIQVKQVNPEYSFILTQ